MFSVGCIVRVDARTWPGINQPGGVGRVTRVHAEGKTVDVKYVLGGRESNVDVKWVHPYEDDIQKALHERRARRRAGPPLQEEETHGKLVNVADEEEESLASDFKETMSFVGSESNEFEIGEVVNVEARTFPGMNKHGGVGRITAVHEDGTFNVKYVLGGSEKHIEQKYITRSEDNQNKRRKAKNHARKTRGKTPLQPKKEQINKKRPAATTSSPSKPSTSLSERSSNSPSKKARTIDSEARNQHEERKETESPPPFAIVEDDIHERARQQSFRHIVSRIFRLKQQEMFETNDLMKLVNEENRENDVFTSDEFKRRIQLLDQENRIMVQAEQIWLV